jgi:CheY-like chemotaxis protein
MNLVINAAEAIGEHTGTVLITTGLLEADEQYVATLAPITGTVTRGTYVTLEVHDTGSGMDEATQAKIFDPFFTTKFHGRGLGLSAVLGIVRGHKGALKLYTAPGRGTTFKVLFPAVTNALAEQIQDVGPADTELQGRGTVLIVDDEELVRRTAQHTLEGYGYAVVLARDGQEAIEVLNRVGDQISVVLLDLTMPVMSGEEALRAISVLRPSLAVILSSGFNEVEAVRRFTGEGLAGFIQKPYTAKALARKIKTVLGEKLNQSGTRAARSSTA